MMIKIPSNDSINETNSPTLYIIIGSGCGIGIIMCIILILVIATCGLSVRSNIKKGMTLESKIFVINCYYIYMYIISDELKCNFL